MSTPQLNLDKINRDDRIERWHAAALVGWVAGIDGRIQTTEATVDVWQDNLGGAPFGLIHDTIKAHFRAYKNADYKPPVDPSDVRAHAKRQMHVEQTRRRSIEGPPRRGKSRVPRRFIEQMQAMQSKSGKHFLADRDPNDYD